jgi:hypothetical protein
MFNTMAQQSDESFSRKEIEERFERLFNRPMTAKERACFFVPPQKEDEKPTTRAAPR